MSMIQLDIRIAKPEWAEIGDIDTIIARAIDAVSAMLPATLSGEAEILLTSNQDIQTLNANWRGKDSPTDVLSFPGDETTPGFLGDIVFAYEVCQRDAESAGLNLADHLSHLAIHGFLHLVGYDHETETDAEEMEALEVKALASLGLPDPYSR